MYLNLKSGENPSLQKYMYFQQDNTEVSEYFNLQTQSTGIQSFNNLGKNVQFKNTTAIQLHEQPRVLQ